MSIIKKHAVSGMFYPKESADIKNMINNFLKKSSNEENFPIPKALIVPHAGYIYSGQTAAKAYACLKNAKDKIKKVILLGPAHKVPFLGIAASSADYFSTPLGQIKVEKNLIEKSLELNEVNIYDDAFETEHCLEVQLPFLQMLIDDFAIAPFLIGDINSEKISEMLNIIWGDDETLIVISSDLSHFYPYEEAQNLDLQTSFAIESLKPYELNRESACGRKPVQGILLVAKEKNLKVKKIDLTNSGDTAGDKSSVVGYGSYHIL